MKSFKQFLKESDIGQVEPGLERNDDEPYINPVLEDTEAAYKSSTGMLYTKSDLEKLLKDRENDFNESRKREKTFRDEAKKLHDQGKPYKFNLEMAQLEDEMQNNIADLIENIKRALKGLK